jgi:hypothetical protein
MDAPSFTSKSWHAWSPPFKQKPRMNVAIRQAPNQFRIAFGALLPAAASPRLAGSTFQKGPLSRRAGQLAWRAPILPPQRPRQNWRVYVRRFGVGERVVPQSYSQSIFETTQAWMHERNLFDVGPEAGVSYAEAVRH